VSKTAEGKAKSDRARAQLQLYQRLAKRETLKDTCRWVRDTSSPPSLMLVAALCRKSFFLEFFVFWFFFVFCFQVFFFGFLVF
jgi:hypothetical protein